MKLMIVESPGKTKKIQEFLGNGWKVMASIGHVRDLPPKKMGVAAPDFKPSYEATERGKEVLSRLMEATKNAEEVYLATDPDREGEAIAWHILDALNLKNAKRVTFGEITEKAVKAALMQAREVDIKLVHAQEGRRVLDRFCGYMVSGLLANALGEKSLSAGRVQSPAVRIVVDRERAIKNFKQTIHYGVELVFESVDHISDGWKAIWNTKAWLEDGLDYILDKSTAEKVSTLKTLDVVDFKESESRSAPPPPFTTSTLQQAASNSLKFSPKTTMMLAQKLYEQGHISYMRTDSPNLSEDFITEARAYCAIQEWPLIEKPRIWKSKAGAQEAHEAIRPTHIEVEVAGETDDEKKLYKLIRIRSLACMLDDAIFSVRDIYLEGDVEGKMVHFEARGRTLVKEGWKIVMLDDQTEELEEKAEPENPVPVLKIGAKVTAVESRLQTKKTSPPKRFTESSLVAELEKKGIGRPSTYATILDGIVHIREYLEVDPKRYLRPTELGEKIVDSLVSNFSFMDFEFTKDMEDSLDSIAEGEASYHGVVSYAYEQLKVETEKFRKVKGLNCPECDSINFRHLVKTATKKDSKEYDFFACADCGNTFFNIDGKPGSKQEKKQKPIVSEFVCKLCNKGLIRRTGTSAKNGRAYDFYSCSGFPKCKISYPTKEDGTPDWDKEKK